MQKIRYTLKKRSIRDRTEAYKIVQGVDNVDCSKFCHASTVRDELYNKGSGPEC